MDILFVTISDTQEMRDEVNGSLILGTALLQDGFSVDVLRFGQFESWRKDYAAFVSQITERILEIAPKCVSFYTLRSTYHIILRLTMELKKKNPEIILVFGGPHATATAYDTVEAIDSVDYVCMGEGENTVVPFFRALLREDGCLETVPGVAFRKNGEIIFNENNEDPCDLNHIPEWDQRLLAPEGGVKEPDIRTDNYYMPLDVGRGCPYNCTFCTTSYFWKRTYRLKSVERIIENIRFYKEKYGIRSFIFSHDAFTVNKKLVEEVCDAILEQKLDITWRCTTRIDCITKELLLKMKEAGMKWISLGVETGSKRMQTCIHKRLNLDTVKPMVQFLMDNDIKVSLYFMYGFPEETEEDLNETLELMLSLLDMGVYRTDMSYCLFGPATDITVKNYDQLVYDPSVEIMHRGVFGYEEEEEMVRKHKKLFTCYYHLHTTVRDQYQYLHHFAILYEQAREILGEVRKGYEGDNLRFFKDFSAANQSCFAGVNQARDAVKERPWEMVENFLCWLDKAELRQLKGVAAFKKDLYTATHAKEDMKLQRTYDFSYNEYRMGIPVGALSNAVSELLIEKRGDKVITKPLKIEYC